MRWNNPDNCPLTPPTPWKPILVLSKNRETGEVMIGDGKNEVWLKESAAKELYRSLKAMYEDGVEDEL